VNEARKGAGEFVSDRKSTVWKPKLTAEQKARVDALDIEIGRRVSALQMLRKEIGLSQAELANILQTTQSNVSKMEASRDTKLAVLRKLVEARGGHLKMVAEFDGREIELAI